MRGYRESLAWIYSTPEGLKAYAAFAKLLGGDRAARAATSSCRSARSIPTASPGIEEVMADAIVVQVHHARRSTT